MNANDIQQMFEGITEETKQIIARVLKKELGAALAVISKDIEQLSPAPGLIMNAFRLCPLESARVVILGQDPYIKPGEAMGLSFSVPRGKTIPPSLKNIYKSLVATGEVIDIPTHGDLTYWASQGVLLLNTALTTILGTSNAHAAAWKSYTDALIEQIDKKQVIFIALGKQATDRLSGVKNVVVSWGHPSPLNRLNQTENPLNFKYCNVFSQVNKLLTAAGDVAVDWNVDPAGEPMEEPSMSPPVFADATGYNDPAPLTIDTLWLFTDGGSRGNGKKNCRSSWAFYITDGASAASASGIVPAVDIDGEVYQSSNNRGELSAMLHGLQFIKQCNCFSYSDIRVVSDSEYSINCIDKWVGGWLASPEKMHGKKNLDIILPAKKLVDDIRKKYHLVFQHVRSHKPEPQDMESEEWFIWKCNDIVDNACTAAFLKHTPAVK